MRAYKVTFNGDFTDVDGTDDPTPLRGNYYAATQEEAARTRRSWMERYGLRLRDVTIAEVEIPTSKAALLAFINGVIDG